MQNSSLPSAHPARTVSVVPCSAPCRLQPMASPMSMSSRRGCSGSAQHSHAAQPQRQLASAHFGVHRTRLDYNCSGKSAVVAGSQATPAGRQGQTAAPPCNPQPCCSSASGGGSSGNPTRRWYGDDSGSSWDPPLGSTMHQQLLLLGCTTALAWLAGAAPAAAGGSKHSTLQALDASPMKSFELDGLLERYWDIYGPLLRTIGASGLLGMCTAAALKFMGRAVLAGAGFVFITLQVLQYYHVITINWDVFDRSTSWFQQQIDHGIFSKHAVKYWIDKGADLVTEGVPNTAGFTVGFILGLRMF